MNDPEFLEIELRRSLSSSGGLDASTASFFVELSRSSQLRRLEVSPKVCEIPLSYICKGKKCVFWEGGLLFQSEYKEISRFDTVLRRTEILD